MHIIAESAPLHIAVAANEEYVGKTDEEQRAAACILTILSIPRGPRLVRMASLTAAPIAQTKLNPTYPCQMSQ